MKKTAFSYWDDRIAPVFDVGHLVMVVASEKGVISEEVQVVLDGALPAQKAMQLKELGVSQLVCGAISRPMQDMIATYGIEVHSFVSGLLREVIEAFLDGSLQELRFSMPGCRRRGLGGRGQGFGGRRRCAGGQGMAASAVSCVCPQCAHREPHERGVPCYERKCPKCGIPLMRE